MPVIEFLLCFFFLSTPFLQALKESTVVTKFSDSALQQTPKKSTCLYRYRKDSTIRSSGNKVISGQQPSKVPEWKEVQEPPLLEQAKTVNVKSTVLLVPFFFEKKPPTQDLLSASQAASSDKKNSASTNQILEFAASLSYVDLSLGR